MSGDHSMPWQRRFAWYPIRLNFQRPGRRRMVWLLRWYKYRAYYRLHAPSTAQDLAGRLRVIRVETGVALAALAALAVLVLTGWRL
jgi:hypothetical protein